MSLFHQFSDLFLHLDKTLTGVVAEYGTLTYVILFAIIFAETGLVVTPFLPGDSLLFAAGALCAAEGSTLNIGLLGVLLLAAAFLGDTVNYAIGDAIGARAFSGKIPILKSVLKPEHLAKTQAFYNKYGGKTIIIARFVPIIRTVAPFVAGVGKMAYGRFISYNIIGAIAWVGIGLGAGYLIGNLPFVQKNFSLIVIGIVLVSLLPAVFEFINERKKAVRS